MSGGRLAHLAKWLLAFVPVLMVGLLALPGGAHAATVRIAITWSTDSDIDLHVYDGAGNHAFYGDETAIPDGQLSTDIIPTDGDNGPHSESFTDNTDTKSLGFCAEYFSGFAPEPSTTVNYTITDPGGGTRSGNVVLGAPGSSAVIGSSPDGSISVPTCTSGGSPPPEVESDDANLSVSVDDSRATVKPGQEFDYIIHVLNKGPGTARNVAVNQTFSKQEVFVKATSSQGSCAFDDALACQLGSIPANQQATISVRVIPQYPKLPLKTPRLTRSWQAGPTPFYKTNKGQVSSGVSVSSSTADSNGTDNVDSETTVVRVPGPSFAKPPGRSKAVKGHRKGKHHHKRSASGRATASYIHHGSLPWRPTNDSNYWVKADWGCHSGPSGYTHVNARSWWHTPKGTVYFTWKFRRLYRIDFPNGHEWSTSATVFHPFTNTSAWTGRTGFLQGNGKVNKEGYTGEVRLGSNAADAVYRIDVQWKWWHHHTYVPDIQEKQYGWETVVWCHS